MSYCGALLFNVCSTKFLFHPTFSLPARSTRYSFPLSFCSVSTFSCLMFIRKMLWLRELCSFMSKEQNYDTMQRGQEKRGEESLIQTPYLKCHSIHYIPWTKLMSKIFTLCHFAFLIFVPYYAFTLKKIWHEMFDSTSIRTSGRSTVTHWWQQRDGWPSLHLSHPSLPQDLWQSAQCSP